MSAHPRTRFFRSVGVVFALIGSGLVLTGAIVVNSSPAHWYLEGAYFNRGGKYDAFSGQMGVWAGPSGTAWFALGFALLGIVALTGVAQGRRTPVRTRDG